MSSMLKKAFTLIELLVVIAIIGILSGLIVVTMGGITTQAKIAKAQVFNNSLRNALLGNFMADITLDGTYNDTWNNNTGAPKGVPTAQTSSNCVQNTCYSFDGTDDAVTLPDHTNYTMGTQMTAMIWIKGSSQDNKVAFAHWGNAVGEWEIMGGPNGALRVIVSYDGTPGTLAKNYYTTSETPFDENWHLVGFTFAPGTPTGFLTLYVDGIVAVATKTDANVPSIYDSTAVVSLACSVTGTACTAGTYFNGLLDSARIYNATIPTAQIKELYFAGLTDLFNRGQITSQEYAQRIGNLSLSN